jgi:hypothetical protein
MIYIFNHHQNHLLANNYREIQINIYQQHLLTEKKVGRKIPTPMESHNWRKFCRYLFESHDNYLPIGDFDDD